MNFWVENNKKYWQIVIKCWRNDDFKKKFIKNPKEALKKAGIDFPPHADITIKCDSTKIEWDNDHSMILPLPPKPDDYREDRLDIVQREVVFCCCD